jgi:hypothetical protein
MARAAKREKGEILTRTEKWPLTLSDEQDRLILQISEGLRDYYNWALEVEKQQNIAFRAAQTFTDKPNVKRFFSEIDLYNIWKERRKADAADDQFRAQIPANWVLETFKSAVGAYKSFFALVRNGDPDARTPGPRPEWHFQAIPGCSAFSVKKDCLVLAPEIFPEMLSFPIPLVYQMRMLARSSRNAKFIISRDEPRLGRPGKFWISISYEILKPETLPFVPEEAVYIALGASSIGIVSPKGEEVIELWRSDKYWKPEIDTVGAFLKGRPRSDTRPALTKGSKTWCRLHRAHGRMNRIMARQQTQDRREVVALDLLGISNIEPEVETRLRGHGVHFVVTAYDVRSKEGRLADSERKERSGQLGLNWSAQNTGSIGYLERWLEAKAPEFGGTVLKHRLPPEVIPKNLPLGHENKIHMARILRDHFLSTQ